MDHVIIDTLHLFLMISDAIEKNLTFSEGFVRDKYKHMTASYGAFRRTLEILLIFV